MSFLHTENIRKSFGGLVAVDGVSFEVEAGQIKSLIGPNGAGKTTLFNVVNGLLAPDDGTVAFKGRQIAGWRPHRIARAGMSRTFQNPSLFGRMNVLENVMIGRHGRSRGGFWGCALRLPGQQREERSIRAVAVRELEFVGLARLASVSASSLTFGQRRMVELARALAAAPEANARVVLGAVRRRPAVDVSYVVDIGRGRDMTAACVRDADRKSPRQTAREVFAAARAARRGADEAFGRSRAVAGRVPSMFVRPGMALAGFVAGGLGRRVPGLRLPAHPFGSALISSVEAWGVPRALPPLAPFVHLGLVVAVGAVAWRPWVCDGAVVPRRVVSIGVTFDHRLIDGALAGTMMRVVAAAVERPWEAWPDGGARPPAAT